MSAATHRTKSESEFIRKYRPEERPGEGGYYRQRDPRDHGDKTAVAEAARQRRLWTALDGERGVAIEFGARIVNRLYNIITEVPCDAEDENTTFFDEPPKRSRRRTNPPKGA